MTTVREPARDTPVAVEADAVICGGGPAGFAAAVACARGGARTVLLEQHGCLGGIWTAGALAWFLDVQDKPGMMRELLQRLSVMDGRPARYGRPANAADVEQLKLLLDELCLEAKVDVRLHTHAVAAIVSSERRMTHVITESKSGRQAIAAKCFVDCTGDGDVAHLAGCGFDLGEPGTGRMQPMSLIALVTGLDPARVSDYYRSSEQVPWAQPKEKLLAEMERGGHSPSYRRPTLLWIRDNLFALMANHEYGVSGLSATDLTRATQSARKELHALIGGLRSLGGVWSDLRLVATGAQIGVREGRRIHGLYTVTAEDLKEGRRHEDAVCTVAFGIDVHALTPDDHKGIAPAPFRSKPYDIPLRALIARDVDGLLMAGRCISGDFLAHSSYRVTGDAVALGEAAGRAAARAALTGRSPAQIPWTEVVGERTAK